jgi:membrane protease YdiL (CAAX protease family)
MSEREIKASAFVKFAAICFILILLTAAIMPLLAVSFFDIEFLSRYSVHISTFIQIFVILVYSVVVLHKIEARPAFETKLDFKKLFRIIGVAALVFVVSRLFVDGAKWMYIGATNDFESFELSSGMETSAFIAALLFLALIPAVCEEMFYRVAAFNLLKQYKISVVVVASSVAFCLAHISVGWEAMLAALILGVVLMREYATYKNYLFVVLMHFFYNAISLFFTHKIYWVSDCAYISSRAASGTECFFWGTIYVSCSILVVAGAFFIRHLLKTLPKKKSSEKEKVLLSATKGD